MGQIQNSVNQLLSIAGIASKFYSDLPETRASRLDKLAAKKEEIVQGTKDSGVGEQAAELAENLRLESAEISPTEERLKEAAQIKFQRKEEQTFAEAKAYKRNQELERQKQYEEFAKKFTLGGTLR